MNYNLDIFGYYRDLSRTKFTHSAGIYFVYRGRFIPHLKTVTLMELLYVGETDDLYVCNNEHVKRQEFLSKLQDWEELFYSYAITDDLSMKHRKILEAALIYELRPSLNGKDEKSFQYEKTTIEIRGDRHAYIPSHIVAPSY